MIVIRCDSSFEIGTGHIMRCLTLAESLRSLGLKVHFVCRNLKGNISEQISQAGFPLSLIGENSPPEKELILALNPDWLVVDHYQIDKKWELDYKDKCRIFVVDDLADRGHLADFLLDQNYHREENLYANLVPSECRCYVGPQFCLLKNSVLKASVLRNQRKNVVCFFGGTDFTGETLKLVKALEKIAAPVFFHVVIGPKNVNFAELVGRNGKHFEVLVSPENWEELLSSASLYFGSGGTVTWERLFFNTPGVVVSVAKNQEKIAQDLAQDGLQLYWGRSNEQHYDEVLPRLIKLVEEAVQLDKIRLKSQNCVRPFPELILKMIFEPIGFSEFQVKQTSLQQAEFLLEVRNDELTRNMSKNSRIIQLDDHKKWLSQKLKDQKSRLYTGYFKSEPIGQFRVDADGITGVSLHPKFRGQGLASRLIREGTELFFSENPKVTKLFAEIKPENQASLRSFKSAGYILAGNSVNAEGFLTLTCEKKN
ncbi:MAG: UDP-2,4-diacetamido-2,4,6-trideoxy-beta-L-altropyranose hydrolase [Pseudobdellovibrio sp.]